MHYTVEHRTTNSIRIHLPKTIGDDRTEAAAALLRKTAGIKKVTRYRATHGLRIDHELPDATLEKLLKELNGETLRMAEEEVHEEREALLERLRHIEDPHILEAALQGHRVDFRELSARKLDPALKRRMRLRILGEAAADLLLPAPVQVAYHAWQIVTLKSL